MIVASPKKLVVFGASNILSDIFDAAMSVGWSLETIVRHEPEPASPRSTSIEDRVAQFGKASVLPKIIQLDDFSPEEDEVYLLGPTTPERRRLQRAILSRWDIRFDTLVHRTAYVSPIATLGEGVFIGANSVVAPGACLMQHVFVNRGVTVGHDTLVGEFSRIQPGANIGGLSVMGERVTVGIGAVVLERLHVGNDTVVAGGAVVISDVPAATMVAGVPAVVKKQLNNLVD